MSKNAKNTTAAPERGLSTLTAADGSASRESLHAEGRGGASGWIVFYSRDAGAKNDGRGMIRVPRRASGDERDAKAGFHAAGIDSPRVGGSQKFMVVPGSDGTGGRYPTAAAADAASLAYLARKVPALSGNARALEYVNGKVRTLKLPRVVAVPRPAKAPKGAKGAVKASAKAPKGSKGSKGAKGAKGSKGSKAAPAASSAPAPSAPATDGVTGPGGTLSAKALASSGLRAATVPLPPAATKSEPTAADPAK